MASIYLYNLQNLRCVEISHERILEEDVAELKAALPSSIAGLSFQAPSEDFHEATIREFRVEAKDQRVADYLQGIGKKLEGLRQTLAACRFYELAYRITQSAPLLLAQARCLSELGDVTRAVPLIEKSIAVDPNAEAYFLLGRQRMAQGDYDQAFHFFEKSREMLDGAPDEVLENTLETYQKFVSIYFDRDRLFTRDLDPERCVAEIHHLRERSERLTREIEASSSAEFKGMLFFLETQRKIFEKWLEEMQKAQR